METNREHSDAGSFAEGEETLPRDEQVGSFAESEERRDDASSGTAPQCC